MSTSDLSHDLEGFVPGALTEDEKWWIARYDWLLEHGFQLRRRYRPDWTPSWEGNSVPYHKCEDGQRTLRAAVNDAQRVSDGTYVVLKKLEKSRSASEIKISTTLSQEPLRLDPKNHSIHIISVLDDPHDDNWCIMVMPLLQMTHVTPFQTVGEVIQCVREVSEGLLFLHQRHVAHRDCHNWNILMDAGAMYPKGLYPWHEERNWDYSEPLIHSNRTLHPPRYYFIDFGLSIQYRADHNPLAAPVHPGDKTIPEFEGESYQKPYNPFPADVYLLGNFFRMYFLDGHPRDPLGTGYKGLEFLRPLVNDMVQRDPAKRPTMDQVVSRFETISSQLGQFKLRSRVVPNHSTIFQNISGGLSHIPRTIKYALKRIPAVPSQ